MTFKNQETDESLLETRFRAKRGQTTLNIELGLIGMNTSVRENTSSAGSTPFGSTTVASLTGGTSPGSVGCFIDITSIDIFTRGRKHIKDVKVGVDRAKCFDPYTKEPLVREVVGKWEHVVDEILMVDFEDGSTGTTKEHGYFTENGIYRPVWELDSVWHWDKEWRQRKIVEKRVLTQRTFVYNITVADVHNYFANGDAVSNAKPPLSELP